MNEQMSDVELIALVAKHVMGWRVLDAPRPMHTKDPAETVYIAYEGRVWRGSGSTPLTGTWNPCDDLNHAGEVMEAMERTVFAIIIVRTLEDWLVEFKHGTTRMTYISRNSKLGRAICEAALQAKGVEG